MTPQTLLPPNLFAGRTAFITGGGSGINLGVARHFAALGAHVAICGRTQARLDDAAMQLRDLATPGGGRVLPVVADVRDPAALAAAVERTRQELGPIDVLVAGAAGNFLCPAEQLSPNGFRTVIDIDLMGSFHAARAAFDQLRERQGCLIFISAPQSFVPQAWQLHVGAAKAGVDNLMRNLAVEWGRFGIRANSIVPGPIEGTEGLRRLSSPEVDERARAAVPLRRYGTVDDIAQAAVFLASPMAAYVSGTVLLVDGGNSLVGSALWNETVKTLPLRNPVESQS
ncbi:MAG: SDR family oxidoreductase [Vitreoscilla sp.]|nr:SDR family oxidoreductase [Vitreoscilla sp.]